MLVVLEAFVILGKSEVIAPTCDYRVNYRVNYYGTRYSFSYHTGGYCDH